MTETIEQSALLVIYVYKYTCLYRDSDLVSFLINFMLKGGIKLDPLRIQNFSNCQQNARINYCSFIHLYAYC